MKPASRRNIERVVRRYERDRVLGAIVDMTEFSFRCFTDEGLRILATKLGASHRYRTADKVRTRKFNEAIRRNNAAQQQEPVA